MRMSSASVFVACLALTPVTLLTQQARGDEPGSASTRAPQGRPMVQSPAQPIPSTNGQEVRNQPAAPHVRTAAETEILGALGQMEQHLNRSEQILKQQMARAQQLRQQGLQTNDGQKLQQAEQLEREAFQQYQQRLQQFEQAARRMSEVSQVRAQSEAAAGQGAANSESNRSRQPQAQQQQQQQQPERSTPSFRRLFGR